MAVVCIQEIRKDKITSFLVLLKMKQLLWAYCARSPRGRSIILSAFHFEEVAKKRFPGKTSKNEFVTVKIVGFFLTCHHLNAKEESKILQEIDIVTRQLEDTKVWGDAHIWAGDFNSVTRKDYSEWVEIGKDRIKLHAKDPKYDDETKS